MKMNKKLRENFWGFYSKYKGKQIPTQIVYFDEVRAGKKKSEVIKNLK